MRDLIINSGVIAIENTLDYHMLVSSLYAVGAMRYSEKMHSLWNWNQEISCDVYPELHNNCKTMAKKLLEEDSSK